MGDVGVKNTVIRASREKQSQSLVRERTIVSRKIFCQNQKDRELVLSLP